MSPLKLNSFMRVEWKKIIRVLKNGGIVTHPTDTCYGLACDPFNRKAVERLYELKRMPKDKPVTIMVYSLEEAREYGVFNAKALELASRGWPGELTLVVPKVADEGTIGIRIPGDDFTLEMLKRWDGPLITTSANLSGEKNPYSSMVALKGDYVVKAGKIPIRKPSTIMRVLGDKVEVVRQGGFV